MDTIRSQRRILKIINDKFIWTRHATVGIHMISKIIHIGIRNYNKINVNKSTKIIIKKY